MSLVCGSDSPEWKRRVELCGQAEPTASSYIGSRTVRGRILRLPAALGDRCVGRGIYDGC